MSASDNECRLHMEWVDFITPNRADVTAVIRECLARGVADHLRIMQAVCVRWPDTTWRLKGNQFGKTMLAVEFMIRDITKKLEK